MLDIENQHIREWIESIVNLCTPSDVHLCTGTNDEYKTLCQDLVDKEVFIQLNPERRPNSYLCRSDPRDVARVEDRTYICTEFEEQSGPTNNWAEPQTMKSVMQALYAGCMAGRTLYIIPFCMGSPNSDMAQYGIQLTDSAYAVVNMHLMARVSSSFLKKIETDSFIKCLHSVGAPLGPEDKDSKWPCDPDNRYISHFPATLEVWSYGSGYGGNALLGKKCVALRLASKMGFDQGWMAEHMMLLQVTSPDGRPLNVAGAFPSACGKTNLAMIQAPNDMPGWQANTIGDDIAWISPGADGKLYAVNPETGYFGVAPGTSEETNPIAMRTIASDTIFTNVALTEDGDVWWEGLSPTPPDKLIDWQGNAWTPSSGKKAAHPNARFTVSARQCPTAKSSASIEEGIALDAILFGGRSSTTIPLITESRSWSEGVYMGATIGSEATAASDNQAAVRRDPMAMLPFCGYNIGDYWSHWLSVEKKLVSPPKIYRVNWFKKDELGNFLWPGFNANMKIIKWIFERKYQSDKSTNSGLGIHPQMSSLNGGSSPITPEQYRKLFELNAAEWTVELNDQYEYFKGLGINIPQQITDHLSSNIHFINKLSGA
ncbi:phosphoenolpyruvate carboxykinase (GTP) [uncultured Pseudoteredinibacter sp.]|uniref:phosphoenolpyruvate carboxykinase (GTP) n=1 Tax=uncultured Pseudoteredinibacter sp. TaxID=1641701 RepID=UPI002636ED25|nr:phosphoenolpyruvate carboxykinase (GTP) [uncultured Pseudoteredinibacter sp.]